MSIDGTELHLFKPEIGGSQHFPINLISNYTDDYFRHMGWIENNIWAAVANYFVAHLRTILIFISLAARHSGPYIVFYLSHMKKITQAIWKLNISPCKKASTLYSHNIVS